MGWPADAAADIVLAVNEAVTNAVEHAYLPGTADRLVEIAGEGEHHAVPGAVDVDAEIARAGRSPDHTVRAVVIHPTK